MAAEESVAREPGAAELRRRVAELEAEIAAALGEPRLEELKRDLRYWRTRLATAELAPPPAEGVAGIGTRVAFRLAGRERSLTIVGHDEADPEAGLIAFSAPVAGALIGLEAGETADFNGKEEAIELLAVDPAP